MRTVVADTSPLNYLVLIDHASILPALFGTVVVPESVRRELLRPETPQPVSQWIAASPPWLEVKPDIVDHDISLESLDEGEREAILLALSLDAALILMDERAGVAVARRKGFAVTGTLGVLDLAARRGMIDLAAAFERLRRTSFHCRPDLLDAILARHKADP